jgi:hypothetical protein
MVKVAEATIITLSGTAPNYVANFKPSQRMHKRGHIWLANDPPPLTITFTLAGNFTFYLGGNGPMFLGPNSGQLDSFKTCGGVFSDLTINSDTSISFTVEKSDAGKYFYLLNLVDSGGNRFPIADPIIVNR